MVKALITLVLLFNLGYSLDLLEEPKSKESALMKKIESFLGEKCFMQNRAFIKVIFDPVDGFYNSGRLSSIKIAETLKENGLLKLFFESPREFQLNFRTSGSPLFFTKIMGDTLRNIGYYRYVTIASHLDSSEFYWSISLQSEYATDPLVLQGELAKSGCKIVDLHRDSTDEWTYTIDMAQGYLDVPKLKDQEQRHLRRSLYAHWLDISEIGELKIQSSRANHWYPYIAYYDSSLHLLKIIKESTIHRSILLEIPKNAKYIKISDLYSLKNVRDELLLLPKSSY